MVGAIVSAALGLPFASPAQAQLTNAPIDLQIFRPAMDSKGFITLNSSGVLGLGDISFGLVTTYAAKPLVLNGTGMFGNPAQGNRLAVNNLITPSLQAAVGLTKLAHLGLEIGVIVPFAIASGRGDPTDPGANATSTLDDKVYSFTKQGIGDVTVHPKIRLLNATRL